METSARYLDCRGVAALLAMTPAAVRQLVYRREIPFYKLGKRLRFREDDVRAWAEQGRVEARPEIRERLTLISSGDRS